MDDLPLFHVNKPHWKNHSNSKRSTLTAKLWASSVNWWLLMCQQHQQKIITLASIYPREVEDSLFVTAVDALTAFYPSIFWCFFVCPWNTIKTQQIMIILTFSYAFYLPPLIHWSLSPLIDYLFQRIAVFLLSSHSGVNNLEVIQFSNSSVVNKKMHSVHRMQSHDLFMRRLKNTDIWTDGPRHHPFFTTERRVQYASFLCKFNAA